MVIINIQLSSLDVLGEDVDLCYVLPVLCFVNHILGPGLGNQGLENLQKVFRNVWTSSVMLGYPRKSLHFLNKNLVPLTWKRVAGIHNSVLTIN